MNEEKSCRGCKHLDEYFGDCCHPKSGGCKDLTWALEECLRKGYVFREQDPNFHKKENFWSIEDELFGKRK